MNMAPLLAYSKEITVGGIGIWIVVFMLAIYGLREWRDTRKLSVEERQANREGFSKQVELLMGECAALRQWGANLGEQLHGLRQEYDEHRRLCFDETDQLRKHIVELENEVAGMKRARAQESVSVARELGKRADRGET